MTDIYVTKAGRYLAPVDAAGEEAINALPSGDVLRAKVSRPRNAKLHRKFFAMLSAAHYHMSEDAEKRWPTVERLLWELKLQTGQFDVHVTIGGKETVIPHSISFAKMDDAEFSKFYSDCLRIICKHIIPGIPESALREAAEAEIQSFA